MKYAQPEITQYANIIHENGRLLLHHACGHIKALLPAMAQTGIDMVESVSAPPTGNIQPWEVKALLPDEIGVIGGIEPTFFLSSSGTELEAVRNAVL